MNERTKKIREAFRIILDGKLEKIVKAKEGGSSEMHNYTTPYLQVVNMTKKEKYLPKNTLDKYNRKYREIMNY